MCYSCVKKCKKVISYLPQILPHPVQSIFFFFQLLYLELGFFIRSLYLTAANFARLRISVHCQVSVRSLYLVRLLSQCWITGGHTVHPPIERLLPPTCIEPTLFRNSASKVAGLQVHATTPGCQCMPPVACHYTPCNMKFSTKLSIPSQHLPAQS